MLSDTPKATLAVGASLHRVGVVSDARQALRRAVAALPELDELPAFLETLLREALQAAGSRNGAVALLEGAPGSQQADHVVVLKNGVPLPADVRVKNGLGPAPLGEAANAFIERVAASENGLTTAPGDAIYGDPFRRYLVALRLRSVHSVGMRVGDRLIGWLGAAYPQSGPPSPGRIALLVSLAEQMTLAVEMTRMAERSRRAAIAQERAEAAQVRVDRIVAGNRILTGAIEALTTEPVVDAMLSYTLRTICEQHYGTSALGSLWFVDAARGVICRHLLYVNGRVVPASRSEAPFEDSERPMRLVHDAAFAKGAPHRGALADLPPEQAEFLRQRGVGSLVFFPMSLAATPVGIFALCVPAGQPEPVEEDLHFSQALAQQATLAIQLTRLADEARTAAVAREREKAAEMRVSELVRANGALKRSLDLIADDSDIADTLGRLLQVVSDEIGCSRATLCLRDEASGAFEIERICVDGRPLPTRAHAGHPHLCPAAGSPLWRAIVQERRAVAFEDIEGAPPMHPDLRGWFTLSATRSLIGVPLLQRGEVIGCFTFRFETPQRFSPDRLELLQTLAHQATLSVQLERLARAAQSKSHRAATLAERARIARDLHDTLAQGLTGILMHLQASERTQDVPRVRVHVHAALEVARGALVDAGRSVHALRSIASERPEFASALKAVLKTTFAGSDVALEVGGAADLGGLSEAVEKELLRIAQEAASNALKHARASRFDAHVTQDDASIVLELADDGVGFETAGSTDGFGLVGMRERAARAGATLSVESRPGGGTRLRVTVPAGAERLAPVERT